MSQLLSENEIDAGLRELDAGWSRAGDTIKRSVEATSFLDGIALVDQVAQAAEDRNHHPDIDIRWTTVTFALSTHSEGGLTSKDLELAGVIDSLAIRPA